jgi:murein DD-endopeptidase MepM/ murein hydrolase activator NlpD
MSRMPSPTRSVDPLAGLPRPLAERDQARSRARRSLTIGLATGIVGVGLFVVATTLGTGPFRPVGDVAGAVSVGNPADGDPVVAVAPTPEPSPTPVRSATARPARGPAPTATPVPTPAPPEALTGYQWPLPRGRITLKFGPSPWGSRIVDGEKFHDGLDLATFCGDRIVAAHAGTVLAAGRRFDAHMGWVGDLAPYLERLEKKQLYPTLPIMVVIDDGNGYRSMYAHFSKVVVKKGQEVKAGQLLGYEGRTGRASGCHLHYGLFSPLETATFEIDPAVVKRMKLPDRQIARIDPLLVLPPRPKATPKPTPVPTVPP